MDSLERQHLKQDLAFYICFFYYYCKLKQTQHFMDGMNIYVVFIYMFNDFLIVET